MEKHDRALVSGMVITILEIWTAWLVFITLTEMIDLSGELWSAYGFSVFGTVILTILTTLFLYIEYSSSWEEEVRVRARKEARKIVESEFYDLRMKEKKFRKELNEATETALKKVKTA